MNNPAHEETMNNLELERQWYAECLEDAIDEYAHDGARAVHIIAIDYGVTEAEILEGAKRHPNYPSNLYK